MIAKRIMMCDPFVALGNTPGYNRETFNPEGENLMRSVFLKISCLFYALFSFGPLLRAEEAVNTAEPLKRYADMAQKSAHAVTLWEVLHSGGIVMGIIMTLSLIMLALSFYLYMRFQAQRIVPSEIRHKLIQHLAGKQDEEAKKISLLHDCIVSHIALAALEGKSLRGPKGARHAAEERARTEISGLWAKLNYLLDIIQAAPMLGLLGTVVGMIEAFNTIASDSAAVKPLLLAAGVGKAMINTAGGLAVALAALALYSLLKPSLQALTFSTEKVTEEILEAMGS